MKIILYSLLIVGLLACNNKPEPVQSYNLPPGGIGSFQQPESASKTMTSAGNSSLIFNPAHGQPGHDCSIAVGAPLKAGAPVTQQVVQQPSAAMAGPNMQQMAAVSTTKKGLNPPHGEPGHRCDIAVGAPLSGSPAQQGTPTVTPAATNGAEAMNGLKLNPQHGEPGHRCDIAVGAPLTNT